MTTTLPQTLLPLREAIENATGHQLLPLDKLHAVCDSGQSKCTKRAGRRFFPGEWLIALLQGSDGAEAQSDA